MKFALIFLLSALVALSQQQFLRPRPHGLVWWSPYLNSQLSARNNIYLTQPLYDGADQEEIPTPLSARRYRPSRPVVLSQNEDLNADFANDGQSIEEIDGLNHYPDNQQRANVYRGFSGGRLFYSSTINNPFFKTATFTLTSTVTTLASIIICVPANNLAVKAPACAGRKRRGMDDTEVDQFPITPSETMKLTPTAVPSFDLEARQLDEEKKNEHDLISSKDELLKMQLAEIEKPREKRFFGGGIAASTTVISYSFIGAVVTSTVLLDPAARMRAACLPAGYVVCA